MLKKTDPAKEGGRYSRTQLFSLAEIVAGAIVANLATVQGLIPTSAYGWILCVLGIVHMVLRKLTNQPLK